MFLSGDLSANRMIRCAGRFKICITSVVHHNVLLPFRIITGEIGERSLTFLPSVVNGHTTRARNNSVPPPFPPPVPFSTEGCEWSRTKPGGLEEYSKGGPMPLSGG